MAFIPLSFPEILPKYLYTAGYGAGWSRDSLGRVMEAAGAVLVDIRQAPWSRSPQWQKPALAGMFAERYVHLPALGNLNIPRWADSPG
jgi:uncharacterized protein (DUF488 family)